MYNKSLRHTYASLRSARLEDQNLAVLPLKAEARRHCSKCGDRKNSFFRKLPSELKPFVTLDSKRGDPVVCADCWPKVKELNTTFQTPTRSSPRDTSSTPGCTFTLSFFNDRALFK